MQLPPALELYASLVFLAAVGCGSTSDNPGPTHTTPPVCTAPGYAVESDGTQINSVLASLVLPTGEVAADLAVQVCGLDSCLNYKSKQNGVVQESPARMMIRPAFKYGDRFDFAEFAVPLSEKDTKLGTVVALPLPSYAAGVQFPKSGGGAVSNGDLTLHLDANGSFEHDILSYSDESELVFRSVAVPLAESEQAFPPGWGFDLAYGLAPLGTTFCPPAKLSLKNTLAWPPDTEVEVYVQGLDVSEDWAPYGSWTQVAEARVSGDGKSIDTTSGGLPILSSIALSRK